MWTKHADTLSWSQGHSGAGYLLQNGTIRTWNSDTFHPTTQQAEHERRGELSPIALSFDIDPDGGIITAQPTVKIQTIIAEDPRFYDAGQRPEFEDGFDLDNFEPQDNKEGKPDYQFIMSNTTGTSHYNRWTGKICNCPWNGKHRKMQRTAGEHLNKLRKSPDKAFKTEEGQKLLAALERMPPDYESLYPYFAHRFKKGDIRPNPDPRSQDYAPLQWAMSPGDEYWQPLNHHQTLPQWHQWYEARQHPTRRGINVFDNNFTVGDLWSKSRAHQADLKEKRELQEAMRHGKTEVKFPNGWSIKHLTSHTNDAGHGNDPEAALRAEGNVMGHCIGSDEQPYINCAERGLIDVYSLRDKKGHPHVTWHYNSDGSLAEMFGPNDDPVKPEYQAMLDAWGKDKGLDANADDAVGMREEAEDPHDEYFSFPVARDMDDYIRFHHPDRMYEYANENGDIGEDTQLEWEDPDWESIAEDYHNHGEGGSRDFNYAIQHNGHEQQLEDALSEIGTKDYYFPRPRDIDDYVKYYHPDKHYETAQEDDPDINENTEYNWEAPPHWPEMARSYLAGDLENYGHDFNDLLQTLNENPEGGYGGHHFRGFAEAMNHEHPDDEDEEGLALKQQWDNFVQPYIHPLTGEIHPPQYGQLPIAERYQQSLFDQQGNPPYQQLSEPLGNVPPGGMQPTSAWHFGDYQGWTNWHTWHTSLMMDNDEPLYTAVRKLVERGASPEQIRDWAIRKVIGPYNKQQIADAQEWNDIPQEERLDHNYEDLKDKSPEAADFVNNLGFGPDVSDDEPDLIDPELVNWDEIYQSLVSEANENAKWEQEQQQAKDMGLGWATRGGDEADKMRDAIYRYHGATPEHELDAEGAEWDDPRAYHRLNVNTQEGTQRLHDYGSDLIGAIQRGESHPYIPQMQQALTQRGYTPEEVQQIMRQRWQWNPETKQMTNLETPQPAQPDSSLDQPGNLTIPTDWGRASAYYHVAPRSVRPSIEQHGLDYTRGQSGTDYEALNSTPGNYLWTNPEQAQYTAETNEENLGYPWDVWHVDTREIPLASDPYWEMADQPIEAQGPQAQFTTQPIPPEQIRRVGAHPGRISHQLNFTPGLTAAKRMLWGRGLVHPDGTIYTWPEEYAEHNQMAYRMGIEPDTTRMFMIDPTGGFSMHSAPDEGEEDVAPYIEAQTNLHHDYHQGWYGAPGELGWGKTDTQSKTTNSVYEPDNAQSMIMPAIELQEWLADVGNSAEPDNSPSIHHDSPEDMVMRAPVSPWEGLSYFPPGHIPDQYKQSAGGFEERMPNGYQMHQPEGIQCPSCGGQLDYWEDQESYPWSDTNASTFHCPDCDFLYDANMPRRYRWTPLVTGDPETDFAIWRGARGDARSENHADRYLRERGLRGATKLADSPINQADATNDPLGKNPAIVPSRKGDPDYLQDEPCPHCQGVHRPDEPCPDNAVTQFQQSERAWYGQDPNAIHSQPNGHQQADLGSSFPI